MVVMQCHQLTAKQRGLGGIVESLQSKKEVPEGLAAMPIRLFHAMTPMATMVVLRCPALTSSKFRVPEKSDAKRVWGLRCLHRASRRS